MTRNKKQAGTSLEDLEKIIDNAFERQFSKLEKVLVTNEDMLMSTKAMSTKIDKLGERIEGFMIEVRNLRLVYQFWSERYLSPELMEKFLKQQEKKIKKPSAN